MSDEGFAIRCPYCFEWSEWRRHPSKVAVRDKDEMRKLLDLCRDSDKDLDNPKIFRCQTPSWICPARFEAFVCESEAAAFEFIEMADSWAVKRDFRLYKHDRVTRWDGRYYGILFSTRTIPRQRHIELERLIDPQLLSRMLSGVAEEVGAPVTIYTATFYDTGDKEMVSWRPIESYQRERQFVPPRYNPLCELLRSFALSPVLDVFHKVKPETCPDNLSDHGTCGGQMGVACVRADWNRCPAFLRERYKRGFCYSHDREMIDHLIDAWPEQDRYPQPIQEFCWAGFAEVAIPIVVHGLLLGVAMTGQFIVQPDRVASANALIDRLPGLAYKRPDLERLLGVARGRSAQRDDEQCLEDFVVSPEDIGRKVDVIVSHVKQLARTATARYRDFRLRSESLFRQELLGRIGAQPDIEQPDVFETELLAILGRMREFWGFRAVYLLVAPTEGHDVHVIAFSGADEKTYFGLNAKVIGQVQEHYRQDYPSPLVVDFRKPSPPSGHYARDLLRVLAGARTDPDLCVPTDGRFYFGALVPLTNCLAGLVFAGRDGQAVSPFKHRVGEGISDLCKEVIFDTSIEIIRRLEEVRGPFLGAGASESG